MKCMQNRILTTNWENINRKFRRIDATLVRFFAANISNILKNGSSLTLKSLIIRNDSVLIWSGGSNWICLKNPFFTLSNGCFRRILCGSFFRESQESRRTQCGCPSTSYPSTKTPHISTIRALTFHIYKWERTMLSPIKNQETRYLRN